MIKTFYKNVRSNQWRIQDFPDGRAPTAEFGAKSYVIIWQDFYLKLHENEKSPWIRQC